MVLHCYPMCVSVRTAILPIASQVLGPFGLLMSVTFKMITQLVNHSCGWRLRYAYKI